MTTKISEFIAHSTEVSCVCIGKKDSQLCNSNNTIFATGGNDCKVSLWKISNDLITKHQDNIPCNALHTLSSNKSRISSLCFDHDEQYIVSGGLNGSIKVFDINEGKLARNLVGHQVNVTSLQYHGFGEFIVSGSSDCSMKVWDVRNKTCVQTYSGHEKEITCVRFSPDGRWVSSSGKDGKLYIWDIVAGKSINCFQVSPTYYTNFEFNPSEFMMSAVTAARSIKLYDLETFKTIGTIPPESCNIKPTCFVNRDSSICSVSKDACKIWTWESDCNVKLDKSVNINDITWDGLQDVKLINDTDKLLGVSYLSNFVSLWTIDLHASVIPQTNPKSVTKKDTMVSKVQVRNLSPTIAESKNDCIDIKMNKSDSQSYEDDFEVVAENDLHENSTPQVKWESDHSASDVTHSLGNSFWQKFMKESNPIDSNVLKLQKEIEQLNIPSKFDDFENVNIKTEDNSKNLISEVLYDMNDIISSSSSFTSALSHRLSTLRILKKYWEKGDINFFLEHINTLLESSISSSSNMNNEATATLSITKLLSTSPSDSLIVVTIPIVNEILQFFHSIKFQNHINFSFSQSIEVLKILSICLHIQTIDSPIYHILQNILIILIKVIEIHDLFHNNILQPYLQYIIISKQNSQSSHISRGFSGDFLRDEKFTKCKIFYDILKRMKIKLEVLQYVGKNKESGIEIDNSRNFNSLQAEYNRIVSIFQNIQT